MVLKTTVCLYIQIFIKLIWPKRIGETAFMRKKRFLSFFQKASFENGYAVFAGLEKAIEYLENFKFTDSDLNYLKTELHYADDFIEYLRDLSLPDLFTA